MCLSGVALTLAARAVAAGDPVGWRADGSGYYPDAHPSLEWADGSNVLWKTVLPSWGNGHPVLVADRIFVGAEPDLLVCVRAADGAILWQRTNSYAEALGPAEAGTLAAAQKDYNETLKQTQALEAELRKVKAQTNLPPDSAEVKAQADALLAQIAPWKRKLEDLEKTAWYAHLPATHPVNGYSTPTPVSDGKRVYALYGSGVAACYDRDGKRRWIRFVEKPANGWGHSASPVLLGDRLIVHLLSVTALDAATGKTVWQTRVPEHWGSAIAVAWAGTNAVITPGGDVLRAADGQILARSLAGLDFCAPIARDGAVYFIQNGGKAVRLPARGGTNAAPVTLWTTEPKRERYYASPLIHEGLIYAVMQYGVLSVIDAADGKVVHERKLETGGGTMYPSICLAGGHVFVSSDNGATLVLTPGRDPQPVATNKLEGFRSTPAFAGNRMYVRGLKLLYCIGTR
jgi:outer membrane protein assembly factor BamB